MFGSWVVLVRGPIHYGDSGDGYEGVLLIVINAVVAGVPANHERVELVGDRA